MVFEVCVDGFDGRASPFVGLDTLGCSEPMPHLVDRCRIVRWRPRRGMFSGVSMQLPGFAERDQPVGSIDGEVVFRPVAGVSQDQPDSGGSFFFGVVFGGWLSGQNSLGGGRREGFIIGSNEATSLAS